MRWCLSLKRTNKIDEMMRAMGFERRKMEITAEELKALKWWAGLPGDEMYRHCPNAGFKCKMCADIFNMLNTVTCPNDLYTAEEIREKVREFENKMIHNEEEPILTKKITIDPKSLMDKAKILAAKHWDEYTGLVIRHDIGVSESNDADEITMTISDHMAQLRFTALSNWEHGAKHMMEEIMGLIDKNNEV
jgi:hypothetical protein